jgi:hypothetical protein
LLEAYKAEKEELSKYRDKLEDKLSEFTKTGKYSRSFYLLNELGGFVIKCKKKFCDFLLFCRTESGLSIYILLYRVQMCLPYSVLQNNKRKYKKSTTYFQLFLN